MINLFFIFWEKKRLFFATYLKYTLENFSIILIFRLKKFKENNKIINNTLSFTDEY